MSDAPLGNQTGVGLVVADAQTLIEALYPSTVALKGATLTEDNFILTDELGRILIIDINE